MQNKRVIGLDMLYAISTGLFLPIRFWVDFGFDRKTWLGVWMQWAFWVLIILFSLVVALVGIRLGYNARLQLRYILNTNAYFLVLAILNLNLSSKMSIAKIGGFASGLGLLSLWFWHRQIAALMPKAHRNGL